jgi:hypothetical protein
MKMPKLQVDLSPNYELGEQRWYVGLYLGDAMVQDWDVTDQRDKFEEQPGDYLGEREREARLRDFAESFAAKKLKEALGWA